MPQGPRLAIRRSGGERALAWGFVLPAGEDMLTAHAGVIIAAGRGHRVRDQWVQLDVGIGDHVLYSARTDTFRVNGDTIDIVDENSVLGVPHGDQPDC